MLARFSSFDQQLRRPSLRRRLWRLRSARAFAAAALLLLVFEAVPRMRAQDEDPGSMRLPGGQMLRGTVTAVQGNGLTLKSETGDVYKVAVTDNTRVVRDRQTAKFAEIKVGDGLGAGGVLDAPTKTLHAAFLAVINAEEVRKAQAELGKSYIAGKIAGIDTDGLKLTIDRLDNVKQTIAVDETTSFRRGGRGGGRGFGTPPAPGAGAAPPRAEAPMGESITLADLKVGDSVAGRGSVKNGVFVPTELRVFDGTRSRRNGPAGPAGAGASGAAPNGPGDAHP